MLKARSDSLVCWLTTFMVTKRHEDILARCCGELFRPFSSVLIEIGEVVGPCCELAPIE